MKNSIPQNRKPVYYVKRSLEPKFILFDYKYCAIILLKREIIIWHKTNSTWIINWIENKVVLKKVSLNFLGTQSFFKFLRYSGNTDK